MKLKLLLLLLLATFPTIAATWDGTKDDLTITTIQFNPQSIVIFGLQFFTPGAPAISTQIWVKSSDPNVVAFRVSVTYADAAGIHTVSSLTDAQPNGALSGAFFWNVAEDQIISIAVTRLTQATATTIK